MHSVSVRLTLLDRRLAALGDDPLSKLEQDALLDQRVELMRERERGYRFTDKRRVRAC
jgi:hypothetical protein